MPGWKETSLVGATGGTKAATACCVVFDICSIAAVKKDDRGLGTLGDDDDITTGAIFFVFGVPESDPESLDSPSTSSARRLRMTPMTGGWSSGMRTGLIRFCFARDFISASGNSSTSTKIRFPLTMTTPFSLPAVNGARRTIANKRSELSNAMSCPTVSHNPPPPAESLCLLRHEIEFGGGSMTISREVAQVSTSQRSSHSTDADVEFWLV